MQNDVDQQENYSDLEQTNASLQQTNTTLQSENVKLKRQVAWFQKQIFGSKSERRHLEANPQQLSHDDVIGEVVSAPIEMETITYQRGKAKKQRGDDCLTETGLRFNDDVPIEVIAVAAPELEGSNADQYEVISTKITHRLAQRPASYVVLQYEMPVIKHKPSGDIKNI